MLNWLLKLGPLSGIADRFGGGTGGDLASLTTAMREEMDKKKGGQPLSRLQDAFKQLKEMHKDDQPFNFETAHWPYGPIGAPSQANAAVPLPQPRPQMAAAPVPMPAPRPAEAPQASSPFADFFARNTAMMKDPTTGEFIDPSAAAKHGGILNSAFG